MTPQPPRIATFLMERVGGCDRSLMGDLAEEFAVRGSRGWYWREALAATARAMLTGVRHHPVLLLRAIATYFVLYAVITFSAAAVARHVPALFRIVSVSSYLRISVLEIVGLVTILPAAALTAWIVARFHPAVRMPAMLLIAAWWLVRDAELQRLLANVTDARFVPYLLVHIAAVLEFVGGLLLGSVVGGWERSVAE